MAVVPSPHVLIRSALLAFLVVSSPGAAATDRYVDLHSPSPTLPYTNWTTAATNIQDAVDAAADGDTVWVTNGVYDTGGTADYPTGSALTNRVSIYKPIVVRACSTNPADTAIQGSGPMGSSAVRGVFLVDGAALIGFTITNGATRGQAGDLDFTNHIEKSGGGIFAGGWGATVSNCLIIGNTSKWGGGGVRSGSLIDCALAANTASSDDGGGAVDSRLVRCTVTGNYSHENGGGAARGELILCVISNNQAAEEGGGVAYASIADSTLVGNLAETGGGAWSATLDQCLVADNTAEDSAGGGAGDSVLYGCVVRGNTASSDGGGVYYCSLSNCVVVSNVAGRSGGGAYGGALQDCTLSGNFAESDGGGIYGGTLRDCILSSNRASEGDGGGACNSTLQNCLAARNAAEGGGGAYGSELTNCILEANHSENGGGAQHSTLHGTVLVGNHAGDNGGGADWCVLYNCTVISNTTSWQGGGVVCCTAVNCIVYFNYSSSNWGGHNYYSDLWNPPSLFLYCCTTPLPSGSANTEADPMFVSPETADWRLQSDSPCVNTGTNQAWMADTSDLDGAPRIVGAAVDMGAYEYPLTESGVAGVWLRQYGLPTDGSADGVDSDGDGLVNRGEYAADTIPTNAESVLRFLAVGPQVGGTRLDWQGGREAWQFLEVRKELADPDEPWTAIYGVPPPTPVTNAVVDLGATNRHLMYRIRAQR